MEFRDLKKQYQLMKTPIDAAIAEVLASANFIGGKPVEALEKSLAEYVSAKHCITCANGTDALSLAMMAWDIKEGDAVFVPDFTFFASGEVVSFEGATPVFVDVDLQTFNMDAQKLREAILKVKKETALTPKAVIPVDLFGLPADYIAIRKVADEFGLKILEDAAQGFGGSINGKRACSFGDISATSFFPAKPLGCYGDGGAVFTDDDAAAELIRSIKVHGKGSDKYDNIRIGLNSRLDTVQAAILEVKLKAFIETELDAVNKAADRYTQNLKSKFNTPMIPDGFGSSWAQYTIRLADKQQRDEIQSALKAQGIPSMVYYPKPMHLQQAFKDLQWRNDDFAVTDRLCDTVLSLPMHPYLTEEKIDTVCDALLKLI